MALSLADFLTKPVDAQPYLVYPLLPAKGRAVIGAPPKSLKSMLVANAAYQMAEGWPVWGEFEVVRPLTVLLLEQEIGPYGLRERLAKMHDQYRGQLAPHNLFIASRDLQIALDTPAGLVALERHIEECRPDVLVLDPMRKLHHRREEDSSEMVRLFDVLDRMQEQYQLSTMIVHHTVKRNEWRNPTDPESLRGSGDIFAEVDSAVMVERPAKNTPGLVRLHFIFRRSSERPPLTLQMNDNMIFARTQ